LIVPVLLVCSCKCEDAPRISSFVFEELTGKSVIGDVSVYDPSSQVFSIKRISLAETEAVIREVSKDLRRKLANIR
jgi:hypothetical protein